MKLELNQIGRSMGRPASIIELKITENGSQISADVTNLKGFVDVNLINNLREIADDLEEQNTLMNEIND